MSVDAEVFVVCGKHGESRKGVIKLDTTAPMLRPSSCPHSAEKREVFRRGPHATHTDHDLLALGEAHNGQPQRACG